MGRTADSGSLRYIDRERIEDGSGRWVWRIVDNGRVVRAGIADSYPEAVVDSTMAYGRYLQTLPASTRAAASTPEGAVLLDLDRLERGVPGDDDEPT